MEILNLDKGRGGCMGPSDSDVTFSSGDRLLFGSSQSGTSGSWEQCDKPGGATTLTGGSLSSELLLIVVLNRDLSKEVIKGKNGLLKVQTIRKTV